MIKSPASWWIRALWGLFVVSPSWALETSVADFFTSSSDELAAPIDSKSFQDKLMADLTGLDAGGSVGFHYHPSAETDGTVRSTLDAARACEIHGWEILAYGQLVRTATSYEVEIHIYDHPHRKVLKTILLRSSLEDFPTLITDCAQKVYSYFAQTLQLSKADSPYLAEKNSWITQHGAFWWGVLPPWNKNIVPIVAYQGSYSLRLGDPVWANGEWAWLQEYGLWLRLAYATNTVGIIPYHLFDTDFGPAITENLIWQRRHEFTLSLIPTARIHALDYRSLYQAEKLSGAVWYGAAANLSYRFWIDPLRTFGLSIESGFSWFAAEPFYGEFHAGVALAWRGLFK